MSTTSQRRNAPHRPAGRTAGEAGEAQGVTHCSAVGGTNPPPPTNRGVTTGQGAQQLQPRHKIHLHLDGGKIVVEEVALPAEGERCLIDWVQFTVARDTFHHLWVYDDAFDLVAHETSEVLITDDDELLAASHALKAIFGFGISLKQDKSINFYKYSAVIGDDFGYYCWGGNRDTALVVLNSHGLMNARYGWQKRLYDWLSTVAVRPHLTRVDLAQDHFDGQCAVHQVREAYHQGQFDSSGQRPSCEMAGPWDSPEYHYRGLTYYVGRRTSGKMLRAYEKGKALGDRNSLWVRYEIEYKARNRIIPRDILIRPSDYFAGAYVFTGDLMPAENPETIKVQKREAEITVDAALEVTKHQFGAYLNVFRGLWSDKEVLDLLTHNVKKWPARLKRVAPDIPDSISPNDLTMVSLPHHLFTRPYAAPVGINGHPAQIH